MKQKNTKNITHRRFGSCDVPKSAVVRPTYGNVSINKEKDKEKDNPK